MNLIAAVDRHWAIGYKGKLLNSIPEDMKFFRETTTNKVLIMGRKTLESFPNGLPLKNRVNIVLSRQKDYKVRDAIVVHSVEEARQSQPDTMTKMCMLSAEQVFMNSFCHTAALPM